MKLLRLVERMLKSLLPSPFTIAILLTLIVFLLALFVPDKAENDIWEIAEFWQMGMWEHSLLAFAVQMMLMLVLGHALALSRPVDRWIRSITRYCNNTSVAALLVTFFTVLVALFNWGLGLIFGAILARKVAEHAERTQTILNYPLIAAAGYSGLMVWHGGLSGSAPIKVAEKGHIVSLMKGSLDENSVQLLPDSIPISETIFSGMNLTATLLVLIVLPLFMYYLGKRFPGDRVILSHSKKEQHSLAKVDGAERIDHSVVFAVLVSCLILLFLFGTVDWSNWQTLAFITPNFINLFLLALAIGAHGSVFRFLGAVEEAIGGATGILIQFPLYFGIMGIMNHSGLIGTISDSFTAISTSFSFPLYGFMSAGLVNMFVPSGGGQWGVQGPILLKSAIDLGVSLPKTVMALAYGDQLTNMLQPFWALPLLGITGLSARSILPYTALLMLIGVLIFSSVLIIF